MNGNSLGWSMFRCVFLSQTAQVACDDCHTAHVTLSSCLGALACQLDLTQTLSVLPDVPPSTLTETVGQKNDS
jgi:hypothetical protein